MTPPARARRGPRVVTPTMTAAQLHAALPETQFQDQVVELAERAGWWWWHDTDSRRNRSGLPDLILIRPPRIVFAELKREKGRLRPLQTKVLEMLSRCPGVEQYLWRPSDWETVKAVLTRREPPPPT